MRYVSNATVNKARTMTGLKILQNWYTDIWMKGDVDSLESYFDKDALAGGILPDMMAELQDFQEIVPVVLSKISNLRFEIHDVMEQGDRAWMRLTFYGNRLPDMKPVSCAGQVMIRTQNGKIIEAYNAFDLLYFFEQMGNLPENTLPLFLAGEEFR